MDVHRQTRIQRHVKTHAHTNKGGKEKKKIHDYWQLSPSITAFFFRSEGAFFREMKQGHMRVKASATAFISPLQQKKKEGEEEGGRGKTKGPLLLLDYSHTRSQERSPFGRYL